MAQMEGTTDIYKMGGGHKGGLLELYVTVGMPLTRLWDLNNFLFSFASQPFVLP